MINVRSMASVNFLYRSSKDFSNLTVRLLYRYELKDYVIGAKSYIKVYKSYWENQHDLKRPKSIEIANQQVLVKSEINELTNFILNAFDKASIKHIDKAWLQSQIDLFYQKEQPKDSLPNQLVKFIDYYNLDKRNELTLSTIKKHNVVKHKLERYEKDRGVLLYISNIDEQFKNDYVNFCESQNYAIGTIQRDLVFIKSFCNYAYEKGIEVSRELNKVKIKGKIEVRHPYLNFEELNEIEILDLSESLDNVRDWLIISCYTGQRISDFMTFKADMIRIQDGKSILEFRQQKTGKLMAIPILPKVVNILNKRDGEFPRRISDQKYNDMIKEVCKFANIDNVIKGSKKVEVKEGVFRKEEKDFEKWELVTSHIGRRSFATNFYGKVPTGFLINVTGHSTEAMFLNYIGKSSSDIALEITKYFDYEN